MSPADILYFKASNQYFNVNPQHSFLFVCLGCLKHHNIKPRTWGAIEIERELPAQQYIALYI